VRVERIEDETVIFRVDVMLRDWLGDVDDPFWGHADVLVVAPVEQRPLKFSGPRPVPPHR
jgi:hypothetical protein